MGGDITQLLSRWTEGDRSALDEVMPVVYAELRRIAGAYVSRERSGHTLQPTALVNEAWLRLVKQDQATFENRRRFFAMAAQIMRQVLVDYARSMRAEKRGGGHAAVTLPDSAASPSGSLDQFLALDEALNRLAGFSSRQARVIELRYFGGLSVDEVAGQLDLSSATISRLQRSAEAWLSHTICAFAAEGA